MAKIFLEIIYLEYSDIWFQDLPLTRGNQYRVILAKAAIKTD